MLGKIVGHNIIGFDLPYLLKSSIIHGAKAHIALLPKGRYWPDIMFDTMLYWTQNGFNKYISLSELAQTLGCETDKSDSGKDFYTFDRDKQDEYLSKDLNLSDFIFGKFNDTASICDRHLIIDIETAPLDLETLEGMIPPFDREMCSAPSNYKDKEKIEAYIDREEAKHRAKIIDKAQLDPRYSIPIAIGYKWSDGEIELDYGSPKNLLNNFWEITGEFWQGEMKLRGAV